MLKKNGWDTILRSSCKNGWGGAIEVETTNWRSKRSIIIKKQSKIPQHKKQLKNRKYKNEWGSNFAENPQFQEQMNAPDHPQLDPLSIS